MAPMAVANPVNGGRIRGMAVAVVDGVQTGLVVHQVAVVAVGWVVAVAALAEQLHQVRLTLHGLQQAQDTVH